ncbi:Protoglobin-domain-containing protein [Mucidula mucida]|nr:Protoglobin-domain-containing protein [Mucidula mucida]
MQEVDPEDLRKSMQTRMTYLKDFMGFRRHDQDILNKVGPLIYDTIPPTVDRLYSKLFEFDVTKQIFMQRNDGFDGDLPTRIEDLGLESPQLVYRKIFMKAWCRRVLTADYTSIKTFQYLDKVGIMHTGAKPFKHRAHVDPLVVPYRDCALTLGWVLTVLQTSILSLEDEKFSMQDKMDAVAAVNKVIWMQNDLFARHYIVPAE